jgi:hypothetical protein
VIGLRSEILRRLERLLHFLRELIDAHASPSAIAPLASNGVSVNICTGKYAALIAASSLPAYES